jgi:hypothetical protein
MNMVNCYVDINLQDEISRQQPGLCLIIELFIPYCIAFSGPNIPNAGMSKQSKPIHKTRYESKIETNFTRFLCFLVKNQYIPLV